MTLPRHKRVPDGAGSNDRVMRAPYNFVPLPEAVLTVDQKDLPGHDCYRGDRHTGNIELDIETETLLYTRCAYSPEFADLEVQRTPQRQEFFHHGDPNVPYLPGSSLRGMMRTLVEIIGFGKMTHVYDERLIFRAVGDTTSLGQMYRSKLLGTGNPLPYPGQNLKAGYLRKQGTEWYIAPSTEHNGESFVHTQTYPSFAEAHHQEADYNGSDLVPVWVRPPARRRIKPPSAHNKPALELADVPDSDIRQKHSDTPPQGAGWVSGLLVRSGDMKGKHMHCIIYEANRGGWIPIPRNLWELYEQDRKINRGIPCRELRNPGDPLFYLMVPAQITETNPDGLVFFGPTMMFRIPYDHGVHAFIPEFLRKGEEMDLAEAIFGTTERKGRVRFEDAPLVRVDGGSSPFLDNGYAGRIVPKILSSPKPTSFQNYLVQPIDSGSHPADQRTRLLVHYQHAWPGEYTLSHMQKGKSVNVPSQGSVIRGHKLYWNKQTNEESVAEEPLKIKRDHDGLVGGTQYTVIKPVRAGCHFAGKIHFENLSGTELGVLLAALKLKDENSRHRLGMGKPYGMGRLKIHWRLLIEDRKERYAALLSRPPSEAAERTAQFVRDFEHALRRHHEEKCAGAAVASIWRIPRMEALAFLLDWKGPQPVESKYTPLQPANPWRNRFVIPTPHQVMRMPEPDKTSRNMMQQAQSISRGRIAKGAMVSCIVLEQKTKKGGWRFKVKEGAGEGTLHPSSQVPPDITPGAEIRLMVFSDDPKNMAFKWEPQNG